MDNMNCGEKIEFQLIQFEKTKDEAAEYLGVSRKTFYNWLNGKTKMPVGTVFAISDFLGISVDELLGTDPVTKHTGNKLIEAIYEKLNDEGKNRLEEYAIMLLNDNKFNSNEKGGE